MGRRLEIVIMTQGPELYSTTRLAAAARRAGHGVSYLNPTRCTIDLSPDGATVLYNGDKIVQPMDCIVPRIGASITRHGLTILRQFQAAGVPVLNPSNGIAASRDKLRALQRFAAVELPMPRCCLILFSSFTALLGFSFFATCSTNSTLNSLII